MSIARSARRHKIPSEASRRFERGVDTALRPTATQMAAELMAKYTATASPATPNDVNNTPRAKVIHFKASEVARVARRPRRGHQPHLRHPDRHWLHGGRWRRRSVRRNRAELSDLNEPCDWGSPDFVGVEFRSPCRRHRSSLVGLTPDQQRLAPSRGGTELAEFDVVRAPLATTIRGDGDYKAFGFDRKPPRDQRRGSANPLY